MAIVCHDGPNDNWSYCPSLGPAVAFATLFGLTTLVHTYQAYRYKKVFTLVLIMGGVWEIGGYVARSISIENQLNSSVYTAQLLLILLAPLWINAYAYMLLGRMIHCFLPKGDDRVFKIRARKITMIFVWFDITAFVVQALGGTLTGPGNSDSTQNTGLHIYTGGVGLQLAFSTVFVSVIIGFQRKIKDLRRLSGDRGDEEAHRTSADGIMMSSSGGPPRYESLTSAVDMRNTTILLRLSYIILGLIIFRNIYRLIEFGTGINSPTVKHEWFAYVFDAVPMFVLLVILNVFNPGKYLQGERVDFSAENKEIKQAKKEKKAAKKQEKKSAKEMKSIRSVDTSYRAL